MPGSKVKAAVFRTYGVNQDSPSLLLAIGDQERATMLSQAFKTVFQYQSTALFISAGKGGKLVSGDMVDELRQRRPDVATNVIDSMSFYKKGEVMPEPTADNLSAVAWALVVGRQGRRNVLEMAESVREEVRFEIQ
ncbi:MAG: hypothetical protein Q9221_007776 [Calogaya cf. arnoldii]